MNVFGCSWKVWRCWKKIQTWYWIYPTNNQSYPATQVALLWFFSFWPCFNSSQIDFCHYKHATQQKAGWALGKDCKLSSPVVFCRFSRRIQFPQAVQGVDVRTSTMSFQRLRFLNVLCSFATLQVPTSKNIPEFATLIYFRLWVIT